MRSSISQATVDGVDYITREITIQPGGSTGWHYHDGRVFGVVREGTLTRTMKDCSVVGLPRGLGGHRGQRGGPHPYRPQPGPGASGAVG